MSIATLTIDIDTKLANIEKDLGKLGHSFEKSSKKLEQSFSKAGAAIKGTIAGIVAGFTFDAAISGIQGAIDSLDQLNDAADATGASIENLSALQDIAKRNGHAVDLVTDSILKLNKGLNEDNGGKTAANLKAIGLSAEELKRLDPGEAYKQVADALGKFAENGDKARLVQDLFGRSAKELAPLLKDVSEAGTLQAKITADQAAAAEKFNKHTAALSANLSYMAQVGASEVLPFLNEIFERFNRASAAGQDFSTSIARATGIGSLNDALKDPYESLRKVNEEIDRIESGKGGTNKAFNNRRLERLKKDAKELQSVVDDIDKKLESNTETKPGVTPPATTDKDAINKAKRDAEELIKRRREAAKYVSDTLAQIESGYTPEVEESLEREAKLREQNADAVKKQVEYFKELADPAAKYREQLEQVVELRKQLDAGASVDITKEQLDKATDALNKQIDSIGKVNDAAQQLGLTFSSAFEAAVMGGKELDEILGGLLKDLGQMALRKGVTEPLANWASGLFTNLSAGSGGGGSGGQGTDTFGSIMTMMSSFFADGGVMTSKGPLPLRKYAGGGIARTPQVAVFGEGDVPEAYVPVPSGRIPVELNMSAGQKESGGMKLNYSPQFFVDSRSDRAAVMSDMQKVAERANADLVDRLERSGKL